MASDMIAARRRYPLIALGFALAVAAVGCNNDKKSAGTPTPIVTESPRVQPTEAVPTGTVTGLAELDRIIGAALEGDAAKLESYFLIQPVPCSNALGLGGPPPCRLAPSGSAPDGTLVDVFPASTCELGWWTDAAPYLQQRLTPPPRLYAVVEFTSDLFAEPYLPQALHGIILETQNADGSRHGWMLQVQSGKVVYLETVCEGPPELFFQTPPYQGRMKLILKGPAFR